MRIKVSLRHELATFYKTTLEFKGSGTIDDPYLISPVLEHRSPLYSISFSDSSSHIQFTNYKGHKETPLFFENSSLFKSSSAKPKHIPKVIRVEKCSNLTIIDSIFNKIKIVESSDINLKNVTILKVLEARTSSNIRLKDSTVNVFRSQDCKQILISKSKIKKISKNTELSSIQYQN